MADASFNKKLPSAFKVIQLKARTRLPIGEYISPISQRSGTINKLSTGSRLSLSLSYTLGLSIYLLLLLLFCPLVLHSHRN